MKMANNPVKYEVLAEQYLRSILDVSDWFEVLITYFSWNISQQLDTA